MGFQRLASGKTVFRLLVRAGGRLPPEPVNRIVGGWPFVNVLFSQIAREGHADDARSRRAKRPRSGLALTASTALACPPMFCRLRARRCTSATRVTRAENANCHENSPKFRTDLSRSSNPPISRHPHIPIRAPSSPLAGVDVTRSVTDVPTPTCKGPRTDCSQPIRAAALNDTSNSHSGRRGDGDR
jgi:hypothetical protein